MGYWWDGRKSERYWFEIRRVAGLGESLWAPTTDERGRKNGWYDLVGSVKAGDVIYHYDATQSRFVGRTTAAANAVRDPTEGYYRVALTDFEPISAIVDLGLFRSQADDLYELRDVLRQRHPGVALYLPFQYTQDRGQIRMMSNYFTKAPRALVTTLFGPSGLARDALKTVPRLPGEAPPEPGDCDIDPGTGAVSFLKPFRRKADTDYVVDVVGGRRTRTRRHEKLVNDCAAWLESKNLSTGRNAAVDLGVQDPPVIIEAKTIRGWAISIREAVGQLYEYRYFKVADPLARLVFLSSEPVPAAWVRYLERDRDIGVMWPHKSGYYLSPKARRAFKV